MKITLRKTYSYVVRFYDKNNQKIGYMTCSKSELEETINKKEFFGKQVKRTDYNKV